MTRSTLVNGRATQKSEMIAAATNPIVNTSESSWLGSVGDRSVANSCDTSPDPIPRKATPETNAAILVKERMRRGIGSRTILLAVPAMSSNTNDKIDSKTNTHPYPVFGPGG